MLTWAGISFLIAPEALAVPWGSQLAASPTGIGLLFAASPAGVVVGLLAIGRVSAARGQRLLLPLAELALLPLLPSVVVSYLPLALVLVFLSGVGGSYNLLARVAFVRGVGDEHRGRAFAVASAGVTAGQGVGIAFAGVVAALTSPAAAVTLSAAVGLALVGLAVAASPAPAVHLDESADPHPEPGGVAVPEPWPSSPVLPAARPSVAAPVVTWAPPT